MPSPTTATPLEFEPACSMERLSSLLSEQTTVLAADKGPAVPSQQPGSSVLLDHDFSSSDSGISTRQGAAVVACARSRGALGSTKCTAPVASNKVQMRKQTVRRGIAKASGNGSGKRVLQSPAAAAAAMAKNQSALEKQEAALRAKVQGQQQQWSHLQSKVQQLLTTKEALHLQMQNATAKWQEVAFSNNCLSRENEEMHQQIDRLRHQLQTRADQQQQQHQQHQHQQVKLEEQQVKVEEQQEVKWLAGEQGERESLLGYERDWDTAGHKYQERSRDINQRVEWLHQKLSEQQQLAQQQQQLAQQQLAQQQQQQQPPPAQQQLVQQQQPARQQQQQQQDEEDWQALLIELFGNELAPKRLASVHHIAEVDHTQQQQQQQIQEEQQEQREQRQAPSTCCQALTQLSAAVPAPAAAVPLAAAEMQGLSRAPLSALKSEIEAAALAPTAAAVGPAPIAAATALRAVAAPASTAAAAAAAAAALATGPAPTAAAPPLAVSQIYLLTPVAAAAAAATNSVCTTAPAATVPAAPYSHPTPRQQLSVEVEHWLFGKEHFAPGSVGPLPMTTHQQQQKQQQEHHQQQHHQQQEHYHQQHHQQQHHQQQHHQQQEHYHQQQQHHQQQQYHHQQQEHYHQQHQHQQQQHEGEHQQFLLPQQCVWQQQLPDLMPLDRPLSLPDLGQHCQSADCCSSWTLTMPASLRNSGLHAAAAACAGANDAVYPTAVASDTGYPKAAASDTGYPTAAVTDTVYPTAVASDTGYLTAVASDIGYPTAAVSNTRYPTAAVSDTRYPTAAAASWCQLPHRRSNGPQPWAVMG